MARRSFERPRHPRLVGRKAIVVCEGEKTERGYFEAIRQSMRLPTLRLKVIFPEGTDPLTIVTSAVEEKRVQLRERAWFPGDVAWAVFDGDEHRLSIPDRWQKALQLARANQVKVAVSNPNFELWYLLHYQNHTADINRANILKLLRKHLPRYEKSMVMWPTPLQPLTKRAVARAEELLLRINRDRLPEHANPSTGVHELVQHLLDLG
jgi:RloB-like protein